MLMKPEKKNLLLIMGLIYLSYIAGMVKSPPLHTSSDELGAIVGAATLAGRNWTGVIENTGYYGFGYYALFFLLFRITDSPIIIYRVIIIITSFMRVLIIPIAYYIAKYYLRIQSEWILYLCSATMPFLYSTSTGIISNEYVIELVIWIVILLACKIIQYQNKKLKRNVYMCLLIITCFYSLFIHTRVLVLSIAVIITFLFNSLFDRSKHNKAFSFLLTAGLLISYLFSKKMISLYQVQIYGKAGDDLRNATVSVSTNFNIFNLDTWGVWLHMLLGILNSEILVTGGMFLISIVTFCFYLTGIKKKLFWKENIYCNMILCISILSMGATICAFLLSDWFGGILGSWGLKEAGTDYAYKGLTYIRYWNIYMPPFVLCTISIFKNENCKKIVRAAAICYVLLQVCFMNFIIPLIQNNASAAGTFFGISGYHFGDKISDSLYYKVLLV